MKRRDFFKLVGASAAFAAVPLLSSCSSAAAPSAEGAGGQRYGGPFGGHGPL